MTTTNPYDPPCPTCGRPWPAAAPAGGTAGPAAAAEPAAYPAAAPARSVAPVPGTETKQLLLGLGALCLVVALTAGTALVFAALGPHGQVGLMAAVTAAFLAAGASLRRMPATAEALAAVGLAGCAVDAAAARTLGLPAATSLPLHDYVGGTALVVLAIAAALTGARHLRTAPAGAAVAALVAAAAWVHPVTEARAAVLAPVGLAVAGAVDVAARRLGAQGAVARWSAAAGAVVLGTVGLVAATGAAHAHRPAGWWGLAVPLALLALPWVTGRASDPDGLRVGCGSAAGGSAAVLAAAAGQGFGVDVHVLAALVLPTVAVALAPWNVPAPGWRVLRAFAVALAAGTGAAAWWSLVGDERAFAAVDAVLAAVALLVAASWPRRHPRFAAVRDAGLAASILLASVAAGLALHLHGASTPSSTSPHPRSARSSGRRPRWSPTGAPRRRCCCPASRSACCRPSRSHWAATPTGRWCCSSPRR